MVNISNGILHAFEKISSCNGAFLLDSGTNLTPNSRYSFAGFNPVKTFSSRGGFVTIDNRTVIDTPLSALKNFLQSVETHPVFENYLPFCGGAVGYVSHEWGHFVGNGNCDEQVIPDLYFGIYDTVLTYDHLEKTAWITSLGLTPDGNASCDLAAKKTAAFVEMLDRTPISNWQLLHRAPSNGSHDISAALSKDDFITGAGTLKKFGRMPLFAGSYAAPTHKAPWDAYQNLRNENPSAFGGYINLGNAQILSSSRTSLLKVDKDKITGALVKGTAPTNSNPAYNSAGIAELANEDEIQTSHRRMLCDMMLSLGKVAQPSTIEPVKIAEIASDARAHHLSSTITATKIANASTVDCLLALLPAATDSHTSAVRAALEKRPRSIYTGSIGYVGFGNKAEFNLAYRTLLFKEATGYLHSGTEIRRTTDPEEAFYKTASAAKKIFEIIRT